MAAPSFANLQENLSTLGFIDYCVVGSDIGAEWTRAGVHLGIDVLESTTTKLDMADR